MTGGEHVRRTLITALIMLVATSFLLYALTHVIPGDPIRALFGFRPPPPELLAELRGRYGLDDPFYVQYLKFLRNAVRGDFGFSTRGAAVRDIVAAGLPVSLRLGAIVVVVQAVVGIGVGVAIALRRDSIVARLARTSSLVLVTVPIFVIAFLLQAYIGVEARWLPVRGLAGGWKAYVLPSVALAAGATGYTIRVTYAELRSVLREPFIAAATARGLGRRRVVAVHALRAAAAPVVTLMAANAAQLIGGLIIVEGIFSVPGVGLAVIDAIRAKDHNVIVAVLGLAVVFSVIANTTADLLHARLDPRIVRPQARAPL